MLTSSMTPPKLGELTAVVLAGGLGTRIRALLSDLPKPMAPVLGRPFLEWVVRYLANQGVGRILLSTGYLGEKVEAHFSRHSVAGVSVRCLAEPQALGTRGASSTRHESVASRRAFGSFSMGIAWCLRISRRRWSSWRIRPWTV